MSAWPFDLWLKYAVKILCISPQQFWDMSLQDWFSLSAKFDARGLERARFDDLMKHYPDQNYKKEKDND